jgi:molybdopterin-biosynthesis enzyme MoeA-like protein
MPESNRKQALLPAGSLRIDNLYGTAPGFAVQRQRCWFVFLPGVPSEMRPMFTHSIMPLLQGRFSLQPSKLISVRTFGIGESAIQQTMNLLEWPPDVQLGFRAGGSDVQTKLLFPPAYPKAEMTALVEKIAELLGDAVFAIDCHEDEPISMPQIVGQLMAKGSHTLTLIETASQGLVSSLCLGEQWLLESRYELKQERLASKLGIAMPEDLSTFATRLAYAAQKSSDATWALVQVYQGGYDGMQDKDVAVTVHTVLLTDNDAHQSSHTVAGTNKRKQNQAALLALDLLRRVLQFGQYHKLPDGNDGI